LPGGQFLCRNLKRFEESPHCFLILVVELRRFKGDGRRLKGDGVTVAGSKVTV
jgi:hypothetical protein